MRKLGIILASFLLVFALSINAQANKISVTGFVVDNNGLMSFKSLVETATTSDTVTASESGKVFLVDHASTTPTFTLPTAASGLTYSFIADDGDADGSKKIIIDPAATDTFVGCVNSTSTTTFAAGDALISPGATGDTVTLVGIATKWYCVDRVGTWADNN